MKIEKLHRILLIRFLFVLTIIFFQFADGQTIENVLTSTNLDFTLDNFQEKEIVRLSVPEGITTVEVEITLPLGVEYAEGTAVITKGEAKIIQKTGTLLSQPTFVVTINKGNTITFEFNREVTSQALLLKGELKDTVKLKVGERLYDTKLSNGYYLHLPSLLLQPSPIVFDKKDGEHNDFFVLSNTGIGGVKDIYFSVDYPEEVSLIDLKYKGKKILPIGVVPAGYANAGAPLYRVEGTFFNEKKDRIIIYEHYTVANCQANCPIKYATYWGDNTLRFYETKEETKLLHPKEEPTVITLSDDTYTLTTTESTTTTATTVGSVFTNDCINGKPIDIQKIIFSLLPQSTSNTFIITKDGNIIVPSHTSIGRYTLNYRICDNSQPSKNKKQKPICQTATVTIAVLQSVTTPTTATSTATSTIVTTTTTVTVVSPTVITLSDDTYTLTTTESTTTTATTVGSVFTNDRLNGKPIDIQKVIFSLLPQSTPNTFIITKDGNVIVPPQTPIGRYTLNYRICDNSQPSKNKNHKPICQTATVTIAVLQSVTTPTTATSTTITTTTTPTIITLSDDTYTLTTTESTTTTATTVGSVFANDRLNGKPIDIQKVIFSLLPQSTPNTFVITKDGNIIVPSQTPIGHYTLNYRICDNSQPSKNKSLKPVCQTATVTIAVLQLVTTLTTTTSTTVTATTTPTIVTPTIITLSDDTYTITTTESVTTTATTVGSIFSNDSMNGKPIDIQKVIFSLLPQSTPTSFVITKDVNIIVPAQTPIGHYTLNYRICDNSQPSKNKNFKPICRTATVTIAILQSVTTPTTTTSTTVTATTTPTVITLSDDTYTVTTTKSTTTTATTVGSVFANDRLNGKPIDIQKVIFSLLPQSTPNTFVITKDGNIIVPAKTPIGRYTLNYRICDNSQTSKDKNFKQICKAATVIIAVLQSVTTPTTTTPTTVISTTTPTVITLSDDTYTLTTTESTTTTATTVGSVFANDRLNGKPINIQKVIFSLLPQSTPNTFVITKEGNIIVPAHTPIGRYTLNYRICDNSQTLKDKNQKPVCQTAIVTIAILQSVTTPTTVTSTTVTTTTLTVITLSDDTYTLTTTESTTTTATTVGSVFTNDSLNGKPIDIQKVIFSLLPQSTPNTFVITKEGNIIVQAQTPIGCYTLNYRICDNSQPLKNKTQKPVCQTATVTISVLQSVITPTTATSTTITATTTPTVVTPTILTLSDDTYTLTTTESVTTTATTVGSVFTNDRLNGKPIDIQKVIFSLLPQSTSNTFVITKEGNIIVPAHTPIGRYTLNYRICDNSQTLKDKNQKPVCQTAIVTIAILQSVTTPTTVTSTTVTTTTLTVITLSDDTYTLTTTESTTTTATTVRSVLANDRLNGKPIDIQKVIFSLLPQSTPNTFIITKDGNIIIPSQTPIGRYTLNYRICDNSQPSKDKNQKPICQTATVTIAILQLVTTPTTNTPTTVTSTTITATTTPTVVTPTIITLSDDTYTVTTTESTTTTATTVGSVFTNDRLNGKLIDIQKVIFSLLPQSTPISFVITKDGNIIIPSQTPIGRYTLNYRICDNSQTSKNKNHKPICQTATVTIAVLQSVTTPTTATSTTTSTTVTTTPTVITLSDDTYTITTTHSTTTTATTVGNVFANDRINGKLIDIQKVIFSLLPQSTPNTFIITKDGNIIVPSHTPIGRYTLNYRICDNSQPSKSKNHKPVCQTATVTIAILQSVTTPTIVTPTIITLSDDTYTLTTTKSTTTTATTVGSVFTNDRINGKPIDIQKVIFSLLPQSTPNTFIITKDGNIIVPPQTPIGHYTLNYRICDNSSTLKDKNFKPICQTATITIAILQSVTTPTTATSTTITATTTPTIVTPTIITLSDDTYTLTTTESSTTTVTTVGSVFTNDRMNGKPIDIQKVIFSLLPQSTPNTFIITKDGNIIIPAQTPIGRYTLNYCICNNNQASNDKSLKPICLTATITIIVLQSVTPTTATSTTVTTTTTTTVVTPTVITLSDDTYTLTTTESVTTTVTTVGSVFTNDRINGKPIDIQKVIFSLLPQSTPTSFVITKDGNIIVPASTPIGRYTLNYRICDNSQPSKSKNHKSVCQTATVTIAILQSVIPSATTTLTTVTSTTVTATITPTVITLSDDTYTITTTRSTTTTATTVGSVFSNDSMNGKPIDIQKVIFSLLPQSTPNTFIITKDGNIIVPPKTPIGQYTLAYRICDNSQTSKDKNQKPVCQTATVTIVVRQSVTTPTTTTSTTVTATTTPTIVTPTVITLSDDTYTVTTTKSTTTTATIVGSVFSNDRLNGKPIDIQKVIFSLLPQSTPNNFVITKDGNIIVPAQTPIGHYTLNYRICDNSQTSKNKHHKPICQTATVTIAVLQSVTTPTTTKSTTVTTTTTPTIVTPTIITLSDDTYTLTTTESSTTTATTVGSVFTNDHMNGKPIDIQKVIFSLLPQSTPISFVITKDGNIIVPPQTPIGHYTLNYRICDNSQTLKDKNQKPICQTATVTIAVLQSVTTPTTTTSTTVTATITPTVITLSDDTYTITTTRSTTTTATTVGSVFSNDCMNGKPIDIQKVIFSLLPQSTPNTFIITKDGNIIVPPQTPIGRYSLNYRICDNSQPLKDKSLKHICQTATVTIIVLQSVTTSTVITLSDDTYTLTTTESATTTATTVGSVFTNDYMNGKPIDIQKVIFSLLPQSAPNTFVITKGGNIIVPAHTPVGRYTLNYRICDNSQASKDKNQKPVCQIATVTIAILQTITTPTTTTSTTITATTTSTVVTPTVITLSDDTYTLTTTESTTTTATTVGSVFNNDRMNGKPIDIQKVIFSLLPQSTPNTFIITKDGNIIVPPQTPIGRYTLNYRICDNSQPSKDKNYKPICKTATVTIAVLQSVTTPTVITLSDDTYTVTTTESITTTATTVGSVLSNDRLNGKPIDIQKVIFSLLPQSTPTSFIITKDGNIIVPPQTPIGRYTLNYRICDSKDKNHKPVCKTATITITILQTPITATVETATSSTTQSATNQPIAVSDSATIPMNTPIRIAVLDNDTPYTASPKIVIFPTNGDAFVKEDNTILYRPRVRFIGTDYFIYELCTPSSQSCTTATVTIKVTHRVVPDNAMSANGDDKNDYFHIVGIENYPDNQVTIYNRNGEKVFTISHYDNRQRVFKGIVEGNVSLPNAAHLPQDTYFYLIEYYDENRHLQRQIGWLYLKR